MASATNDSLGYGLGLRKEHYGELLDGTPAVDWLEVLTENYLVPGGKPLHFLERIRARYPLVMHGVSLSIGGSGPLDWNYLRQVRELAQRIEPCWISDHLCWTGTGGTNLHDLLPLPYTAEALAHVSDRIARVQDYLGRQILLENVSSYLGYTHSSMPEWEFLSAVANGADCLILLDINNIFVSARNHNFDPMSYLNAVPVARVAQFHLAGHRDHGDYIVDTHDATVVDPVWTLYRAAVRRFGPVATMIERDAEIPPLADLVRELDLARLHASAVEAFAAHTTQAARVAIAGVNDPGRGCAPALAILQGEFQAHVISPGRALPVCIAETPRMDRQRRAEIYTAGYRVRLTEALANDYPVLNTLLGGNRFAALANSYLDTHPSRHFSLRWFGARLSEHLAHAAAYRTQPLLAELARFEWTLGEAFDAADASSVSVDELARLPAAAWPALRVTKHPSVREITLGHAVPGYWRAIQNGASISAFRIPGTPTVWRVWRHELRNLFRSMETLEVTSAQILEDTTFGDLCEHLSEELPMDEVPGIAAALLQRWVSEGAVARLYVRAERKTA